MSFVKLDTGILDSTLWLNRDERDVFVTALLMAEPMEIEQPVEQIAADKLEMTGFVVPAGWYGFIRAAGPGIVRRALVAAEDGIAALIRLGSPDPESRTPDHGGRRLVRVDGGYLVLNFMRYRDKDNTMAERSRRYRLRQKTIESQQASRRDDHGVTRDSSLAEAEAEADTNKSKSKSRARAALVLPEWLPADVWQDWHDYRNSRKGWTHKARELSLRTLTELWATGNDPRAVVNQAIERGWTGLFAVHSAQTPRAGLAAKPGKQMQGLMALEGLKSGNRLDSGRSGDGAAEALPALAGPNARR